MNTKTTMNIATFSILTMLSTMVCAMDTPSPKTSEDIRKGRLEAVRAMMNAAQTNDGIEPTRWLDVLLQNNVTIEAIKADPARAIARYNEIHANKEQLRESHRALVKKPVQISPPASPVCTPPASPATPAANPTSVTPTVSTVQTVNAQLPPATERDAADALARARGTPIRDSLDLAVINSQISLLQSETGLSYDAIVKDSHAASNRIRELEDALEAAVHRRPPVANASATPPVQNGHSNAVPQPRVAAAPVQSTTAKPISGSRPIKITNAQRPPATEESAALAIARERGIRVGDISDLILIKEQIRLLVSKRRVSYEAMVDDPAGTNNEINDLLRQLQAQNTQRPPLSAPPSANGNSAPQQRAPADLNRPPQPPVNNANFVTSVRMWVMTRPTWIRNNRLKSAVYAGIGVGVCTILVGLYKWKKNQNKKNIVPAQSQ